MLEDLKLSFIDEFNNIKNILIIDKFEKEGKKYIIYVEENNEDNIYSAFYEMINNKIKIIPITKEEDYDIIDKYLAEIK